MFESFFNEVLQSFIHLFEMGFQKFIIIFHCFYIMVLVYETLHQMILMILYIHHELLHKFNIHLDCIMEYCSRLLLLMDIIIANNFTASGVIYHSRMHFKLNNNTISLTLIYLT